MRTGQELQEDGGIDGQVATRKPKSDQRLCPFFVNVVHLSFTHPPTPTLHRASKTQTAAKVGDPAAQRPKTAAIPSVQLKAHFRPMISQPNPVVEKVSFQNPLCRCWTPEITALTPEESTW